ncbi:spiro-SPASM protein [Spirochaetia bacterium 38H-sp]|uniref:Spiro-SPASM protein n=1 Tax=Rarispira pelagica TaxID=3141764 RepID=A0ABU9UAK2_9SPIR
MNYCIILNALFNTEYAYRAFFDGSSAFSRALALARNFGKDVYMVLRRDAELPEGLPGDVRVVRADFSACGFADAVLEVFSDAGCDFVVLMFADSPFFSSKTAQEMIDQHVEFFADYSVAEGYPAGIVPEVLSLRAASAVRKLAEDFTEELRRSLLFDIIKKDINSFDIETLVSEHDVRLLRPSFFADCKRNFLVCQAFMGFFSPDMDAERFAAVVLKNMGLLRSVPAYYQIEVVRGCLQSCSYCPYPKFIDVLSTREFMPIERFSSIIEEIVSFSSDAVIGLSAFGELSLHPDVVKLLEIALSHKELSVLVETSGYGWDVSVLEKISSLDGSDRIKWIVSLDTLNENLYSVIRGDGFSDVMACIDVLKRLFGDNVFLQAVRLRETEDYLESFYRTLKEKQYNVIIQQYDSFCAMLPDKMVVDISPVRRFPCWHISRDMVVMIDGTVPVCKERFLTGPYAGNVFSDSLENIWKNIEKYWDMHLSENYPDYCLNCKEYFTFNF